jgi:hypothetical protein
MTFALLAAGSCGKPTSGNGDEAKPKIAAPVSPVDPGPAPISFVIASGPAEWDVSKEVEWLCVHTAGGKMARFRIRIEPAKPMDGGMFSGRGQFLSEPDSDPSAFLLQLKAGLLAKNLPQNVARERSVPFKLVISGRNMAHAERTGLSGVGTWTGAKLFFGSGEGESQVFLNLDPAHHIGEFSMKDEDYGDGVLRELAKVL